MMSSFSQITFENCENWGQTCSVVNGSGTVAMDVTDIQISCTSSVASTLSVLSGGPKLLSFSWTDVGAEYYRLLKNPDGISGYTQVGEDLSETQMDEEIAVHLTDWVNTSYLIQACSAAGACIDSEAIDIDSFLLQSIGYVKASDTHEENRFGGTVEKYWGHPGKYREILGTPNLYKC
jgi:hypothetical protein